ncbi:Crp/Fnr family transcriptional regulator [bacterium]|nr:Crp/Fnr family transcriptional regulator [bacterium]
MQPPAPPASELPNLGFLSEVSSEHRGFLALAGKFIHAKSGDVLIAEGDSQESLYLILSGTLHIVACLGDRPVLLAAFGEGDSIGEINLFDPATASASAIVRNSGVMWSLSRGELDAFLQADPEAGVAVLRGLLRQVAHRIRHMNDKLLTAEQRATFHSFWTTHAK